MADHSSIEWTEATWNPITGCTKITEGCQHCYAETMAKRLQAMGQANYANAFKLTLQPHMLQLPLAWRTPRTIFVSSMSDLFHKGVPTEYIQQIFEVMRKAHWHRFQVLTKRSNRLLHLAEKLDWAPNIWMGVTVENERSFHRVDDLRSIPARIKFLSIEPLLGPLPHLSLKGIDWVIVGGESGLGARPMDPKWVRSILQRCQKAHVPFFFKQWGGIRKKEAGRLLDGRTWDEMPLA